jgi:hypothetical protein
MKPISNFSNLMLATALCANAGNLYTNFNSAGVSNMTASYTYPTFTLSSAAMVTSLATYHWNNGAGEAPGPSGTITMKAVAPSKFTFSQAFAATGQSASGVPNADWVASVNLILPPGTYEIFDSSPSTWSQNSQSGGKGFIAVAGQYVSPNTLLDTFNTAGVSNLPLYSPTFKLTQPAMIAQLETYHWNYGIGEAPGTIEISGASLKTPLRFTAQGVTASNVANADWVANANILLPPGTYTVSDSSPATWSYNSQSSNEGFAIVTGTVVSSLVSAPVPTSITTTTTTTSNPSPFINCGNTGYKLEMGPCQGDWQSTNLILKVVEKLPAPIVYAQFQYSSGGIGLPSATPVQIAAVVTLINGDGIDVGSTYEVVSNTSTQALYPLCVAGNGSKWGVFPLHAYAITYPNGTKSASEGQIGLFEVLGCQ